HLATILDELAAAKRAGLVPDVEQAVARHPELADDIRSLWATVWVAEEIARAVASGAITADIRIDTQPDASDPEPSRPTGRRFGDYELLDELGRGGMGIVSRAREIARDRVVAIKRLLRGPDSTAHDIERFRLEAQAASRLAHPHVVPVFHVGECEDQ